MQFSHDIFPIAILYYNKIKTVTTTIITTTKLRTISNRSIKSFSINRRCELKKTQQLHRNPTTTTKNNFTNIQIILLYSRRLSSSLEHLSCVN